MKKGNKTVKIPFGVIRRATEKGMKFVCFVVPDDVHEHERRESDLCGGTEFDNPSKMYKAMEDRFNFECHLPSSNFTYSQGDIDSNYEVLTWTFTVRVKAKYAKIIEELHRFFRDFNFNSMDVFKHLAQLPFSDAKLWEIIANIGGEMLKAQIPELIPYGYSEISFRKSQKEM